MPQDYTNPQDWRDLKELSVKALDHAMANPDVTTGEKLVFWHYCRWLNYQEGTPHFGTAWHSYEHIGKKLNLMPDTVSKAARGLVKKGYLKKLGYKASKFDNNGRGTVVYSLAFGGGWNRDIDTTPELSKDIDTDRSSIYIPTVQVSTSLPFKDVDHYKDLNKDLKEDLNKDLQSGGGGRSGNETGFTEFWDTYPKSVDRRATRQQYQKALEKVDGNHQIILAAAKDYKDRCRREDTQPRYIASSVNWLRNERWADKVDPPQHRLGTRMQDWLDIIHDHPTSNHTTEVLEGEIVPDQEETDLIANLEGQGLVEYPDQEEGTAFTPIYDQKTA